MEQRNQVKMFFGIWFTRIWAESSVTDRLKVLIMLPSCPRVCFIHWMMSNATVCFARWSPKDLVWCGCRMIHLMNDGKRMYGNSLTECREIELWYILNGKRINYCMFSVLVIFVVQVWEKERNSKSCKCHRWEITCCDCHLVMCWEVRWRHLHSCVKN